MQRNWVFIVALAALSPTMILAEMTETGTSDNEDSENDGDVYVVHDEVFVEDRAAEIPGSSTIAAKLPLALEETPLAIDSVGQEALETRDAGILGDALQNVAGLNIQSGNGIFDAFTLRGLDSTANGLILVDGAPEPQTAFYQLYNVERVEVLKGPSSFLYGGRSMGGAINLARKQPREGNFTSFDLSGGSFSTWQAALDTNYFDESGRWGLRLNGQWWQSDLHRDNKEAENFSIHPAFSFRPNDRTSVHVNFEYGETEAVPDSGLPLVFDGQSFAVPEVDRERTYDAPFVRSDQEIYRVQVDVETRFSDNFLLRNKTYYRRLDWFSDSTSLDLVFPLDAFGSEFGISRTQLTLDDKQTFAGNQIEALWRVETGGVRHNLLFGFEYAQFEDEFQFTVGLLPLAFLFHPVDEDITGATPFLPFGTDAKSTVLAPYLVDQIHVSEKFQVLLGLRYDDIDFEDDLIGLERDDSKASPTIGAVYSPNERLSVYVNAGEAFSPQSTFVVGESRDPEESQQMELGLRFGRSDGKVRGSLALFRLERDNVAIPDQTGILQQTGEQRNDGAELEIRAELRPGLTASFGYTWTDAEFTEFTEEVILFDPATGGTSRVVLDRSGNQAAWAPENIVSLWFRQDLRNGWGFAAGGRWVDEQFISEDNAFAIEDHFMVDAVAWYGKRPWRFQVNLDNVTDEDTFTRVFAGNSVIPAPGFAARAGIRYGIR